MRYALMLIMVLMANSRIEDRDDEDEMMMMFVCLATHRGLQLTHRMKAAQREAAQSWHVRRQQQGR